MHDGSWRPVDEEDKSASDNEEEISSSNDLKTYSKIVKNSALHNGNRMNAVAGGDVIILDSDDDDEVPTFFSLVLDSYSLIFLFQVFIKFKVRSLYGQLFIS